MTEKTIIIHPGEMLREEFLLPNNITTEKLAQDIKLPLQLVEDLVKEKIDLNKDLATRLALYFDMSTEFWLGIQHKYEQTQIKELRNNLAEKIVPFHSLRKN